MKINWLKVLKERLIYNLYDKEYLNKKGHVEAIINYQYREKINTMFYPDRIETDSKEILTKDIITNEAIRQLKLITDGKKDMTIGEARVRTTFNPSNDSLVDVIKQKSAWLIDICEQLKNKDARLASLAQTAYEEAAMWAVKAATTETPTD